jgi:hypothetical protein
MTRSIQALVLQRHFFARIEIEGESCCYSPRLSRAKKSIVETFSRAYAGASPEEQAALRVWMRDIILPQKEPRKDLALSRRCEKDTIAACDRRILEFPLSMSPKRWPDAQGRGLVRSQNHRLLHRVSSQASP